MLYAKQGIDRYGLPSNESWMKVDITHRCSRKYLRSIILLEVTNYIYFLLNDPKLGEPKIFLENQSKIKNISVIQ